MSLATAEKMIFGGDDTRLLIDESPYQFLPSLAQIFSDTGALVLQQLHWLARNPYFEGERLPTQWVEESFFVQIAGFMWWDSVEGLMRHLQKRTFERKISDLKEQGVLLVRDRVGHFRDQENYKWYAIHYPTLKGFEDDYRARRNHLKEQREKERAAIKVASHGTAHWRPATGTDTSRDIHELLAAVNEVPCENEPCDEFQREKLLSQAKRQNVARPNTPKSSDKMSPVASDKMSPVASDKMSLPIIIDKKDRDLSQTTTDSAALAETANAVAVAESKSILPQAETATLATESTTPKKLEAAPVQAILPGTAAISGVCPRPEPTASLIRRFMALAVEECGLDCTEEIAAAIVEASPLARLSDAGCLRMVSEDWEKLGFQSKISKATAQNIFGAAPELLRWTLFVWPAMLPDIQKWFADKGKKPAITGAFIKRFQEQQAPPSDWVERLVKAEISKMRVAKAAEVQKQTEAALRSLTANQKRLFEEKVREVAISRDRPMNFNEAEFREKLLLDSEFLASLPAIEVREAPKIAAESVGVTAPESVVSNGAPDYSPNLAELRTMGQFATDWAKKIAKGEMTLDEAEDKAIGNKCFPPRKAAYLRWMIEQEMARTLEVKAA